MSLIADTIKKTMLIVDDEEALRRSMAKFFKVRGYSVLEADNGVRAFETIQSLHVDVVISDARMPGGDGIELLKRIQGQSAAHRPALILMSGHCDFVENEAIPIGAMTVLQKPFELVALLKLITTLIPEA